MRGVTLPERPILNLLKNRFVVGWGSNEREKHVGHSGGYTRRQTAVGTTNGAGAHNVQIFLLTKDLHVLHVLPGFWHPIDFERALRFALALNRLWVDDSRTLIQKKNMFYRMHRAELCQQSAQMHARSRWQGFDASMERRRARLSSRDTFYGGSRMIKAINVVVHERILYWPFAKYDDFDVAEYADLGRRYYDLNRRIDGRGRSFPRAEQTARVVSREFHRLDQRRRAADRKANLNKIAMWKKQDREKRRRK